MRSVSDGFLAASGRCYARLALTDGTEVESGDIVSLTLTAACNGATDRLTLGASPAASLTGTLAGSRSDLEGQQISLWLGRTVSGALEEYQMGVFTVTQAIVSDGDTTTLLAYDADNVEMERTTYVPGSASTARAVLAEICAQTGLTLGDTGTLADADVSGYSLEGFTCRAMAGYMAALLGGNAVIDAQGQLCVRWFGDSDVSLGPDEYYSGGLSLAAQDWSLDTLTCSVTTTATETTTDEDGNTTTAETSNTEPLAWGLGSTGVELSNPWMTQAQLALIGADIGGMSYRSGTVSCLGDLRIEAGDMVTVTDSGGSGYSVPVMELSLTYDGGLKASIAAYAQTESDGGGSGNSGPLAEALDSLKVTVAHIQNLAAENLTATNAKIGNLTATYAELGTLVADKADIDDLTAATARITELEADAITTDTLAAEVAKLGYLETDSLSAAVAELGYLTASDAVLTYATIENLTAANLSITDLSADVANITTVLSGSIGTGSLQAIHLTSENVVIDSAVIETIYAANGIISDLVAGTIYTDSIKIANNTGENLLIDGSTIQINDGTNTRVQIGEDASGDYNLYLWNAAGTLIWDAQGLTEAGLTGNGAIIKDSAVADNAAISGTKLDIASVAERLNEDGSLVVDAANITIDNTTLDYKLTTVTSNIEAATAAAVAAQSTADDAAAAAAELNTRTTTLETELSVVQGQITEKVWQTDIDTAVDTLNDTITTIQDQYATVTQNIEGITTEIGDLTTVVGENYEELSSKITTVEETAEGIITTVSENYTALSAADTKYGTCSTAAGTAAKVVVCSSFTTLAEGATICVYFTNTNTSVNPTLNVNGTGAKSIYAYGSTIASGSSYNWVAKSYVTFVYNGTRWCMVDAGSHSKIAALQVTADGLTSTVSQNTDDISSLSSEITQLADSIALCVTTDADTGYLRLGAGDDGTVKFTVESDNLTIDEDGNATFSGTLEAATGSFTGALQSPAPSAALPSGNTQSTAACQPTVRRSMMAQGYIWERMELFRRFPAHLCE